MANTGNLYIEYEEKAVPRPGPYAKAGIERADNTWLYVIGDYNTIFIFAKRLLVQLKDCGRYRQVTTPTSRGYLLPLADARKYAAAVIEPQAEQKITRLRESMFDGMVLHAMTRQQRGQCSLFDTFSDGETTAQATGS
jgi:hypothetical protein